MIIPFTVDVPDGWTTVMLPNDIRKRAQALGAVLTRDKFPQMYWYLPLDEPWKEAIVKHLAIAMASYSCSLHVRFAEYALYFLKEPIVEEQLNCVFAGDEPHRTVKVRDGAVILLGRGMVKRTPC